MLTPVELSAAVDELFVASESVRQQLADAAAAGASDAAVADLRTAVESMVGSYTRAWPRLAPSWAALQSEQIAVAKEMHQHQTQMTLEMETCALALYHPVHGAKTKLESIYAGEDALEAQLQHAEAATSALDLVAAIRHQLHQLIHTHSGASGRSLDQLADDFLAVTADLRRLESLDPAMPKADFFLALQVQLDAAHDHLVQALLDAFAGIVRVQVDSHGAIPSAETRALIVAPSSSLLLPHLFFALHSLHASSRVVTLLGEMLLHQFFTPLLQYTSSHPLNVSTPLYFSTVRRSTGGGRELRISTQEAADEDAPSLEGTILEVLLTLVDFVWQQVFSAAAPTTNDPSMQDDHLASMAELARYLAPHLQPLFVRHLCYPSIPWNVADFLRFSQTTAPKLREFDGQSSQRGLIVVDSQSGQSAIASFLADIHAQFQRAVRSRVLNHTKHLVVDNQFDTQLFSGVTPEEQQKDANDFPSQFYRPSSASSAAAGRANDLLLHHSHHIFSASTSYSVSKSTFSFVRLVYELYFESLEARARVSEACCQSFFGTLRDAIHLYLAISPVCRGADIESILHLSFMFFNDCTFIAKHLARLHATMKVDEMKAKPQMRASGDEACVLPSASPLMLVDLVQPLRELGEKYFLLQVTKQRHLITELLDALGPLSTLEDDATFQRATQSIKQTLHQLSASEKIWNQLMGMPMAPLVRTASDGLSSPTPAHSNGWSLHLGLLLESLSSRLVGSVLDQSDISVESASRIHQLFDLLSAQYPQVDAGRTPSWPSLLTVSRILAADMNLAKLSAAFVHGDLNALSIEELSSLTRALYQDSPHRIKFFQLLGSTGSARADIADTDSQAELRKLREKVSHGSEAIRGFASSTFAGAKELIRAAKGRT